MQRFEVSKYFFFTISILTVLGLFFAFGLYSGYHQTIVFKKVQTLKNMVERSFTLLTMEFTTLTNIHPSHFLQPAKHEGSGVTVNDATTDSKELIFLSGFFEGANEIRLIRRDGSIVARWPVRFSEIFPDASHLKNPPKTDRNIDIHGALALPDGSVVFNFENGGLVKLDQFRKIVWTLRRETHHSIELAEDGGFWVPGRRHHEEIVSPFPPFETPFIEDTIMKVSQNGEVIIEISVPKLFYDNGLEALLTSTGGKFFVGMNWDREIVHLNKIEELSSDIANNFPMFEAGDLVLSIRELNLIMVISPETGKIKWWKIGPWLRQHDPEFCSDGKIAVFNNNTYRTAFGKRPHLDKSRVTIPRVSNITDIDPVTDTSRVVYGGKHDEEFLSVIRGKFELTQSGGLLITEFEGGRVFETDGEGRIIWEYVNRYDSDEVAEITEARIYSYSYFSETNWQN